MAILPTILDITCTKSLAILSKYLVPFSTRPISSDVMLGAPAYPLIKKHYSNISRRITPARITGITGFSRVIARKAPSPILKFRAGVSFCVSYLSEMLAFKCMFLGSWVFWVSGTFRHLQPFSENRHFQAFSGKIRHFQALSEA